ncbi:Nitrite reductase [NAD(P)H] [Zhongshania aliphaticivorans]|uniref:Nitrite reductase [NAD(P)H] n=1 Tax=Zhongshania aliphaticivorans TaxID=1470434 RepID=A0A5S9Q663_9GAMM|nr:nitrite reductase large subunit NirB [Zhongshania aliphaticivorans]CAA0094854.1 Nitrite reductase [NAD(P)H] [Zhongshania aliphaticivorans]CAA0112723.1 Nitrite reductase [NAD(P)H] [Zhongshania aliphaticivorans]
MTDKQRLLIIGNGPVGHQFIESIVESGQSDQFDITVIGEEPRHAYDRVHLTAWFETRKASSLNMVKEGFYQDNHITALCNEKVTEIDRAAKTVSTDKDQKYTYDKLVLATGSFPFVPPVPGHDRKNCFVYRTIEDLEAITAAAKNAKVGAVVGGGLLGLEAAKAIKDLGLKTHVIEFAPRLMAVQVDDGGGTLLRRKIEDLGVSVHTQKNTQHIIDGDDCIHKLQFADGAELETDILVFSAGIRPQDALARQSELDIGERGGIVINDNCQTSDPAIYAIGECALWGGRIYGLIAPGWDMARAAADHVLGGIEQNTFTGADMSTKLKLMGVDVASIGDAHASTPGAKCYTFIDEQTEIYKKIVVSNDGQHLLGAVLIGDANDYGTLLQFALNKITLPEQPEGMILPSLDGSASAGLGVDALPDTAQICSCNNVSKGDLCAAVQDGALTVGDLKACTKAATTCGGCTALVGQVLNAELTKMGVEVNTDLCEHFPYTRQEIYHLVRVSQIKSFDELLEKHGSGHGCEICKPTAASILASCWNDHILEPQLASLQDTNDRYLANMQKNGTYSVVPRMAGGEVTPDGLIAVGQVAKKYQLYTKITGGQRVDLFGATLDQLPLIWEELISAGFESGHAYGKSLRTVKSCVGSTWCRYGVQDSVGKAIDLENRYKGLRSPHKLKMAVSGCTRECAEAQSKDVGVIATEKGWNLYLCGNGGMKPRHADLFASDIDTDTMVKYIDRFLMFYIRTADRLQRTSVWMENLEGGIDYLRKVIIEDSLGICADLEAEMEHIVDTYQCEWKTAIENPEKVKQFRSFVNADKSDKEIVFIQERGQIRPATEAEINTGADLIAVA